MRNIRLTLSYDGSEYVGWQTQPNGTSVQAVVEAAIERFTGSSVSLIAAGRTDAGVHALGQVANFRTLSPIPCAGFVAGLQTYLPRTIIVLRAEEVDLSFHATYAARRKRYRYVIQNARAVHPFLRRYAYEFPAPLDERRMHEGAQVLVGTHDFRAFETEHPNTRSSIRTVFEVTVGRYDGWAAWNAFGSQGGPLAQRAGGNSTGDFIWIEIVADGFLYNMVRAIAGTLIRVGQRKWDAGDVQRILESQRRTEAGPTAPACGLYLVHVQYDPFMPSTGVGLPQTVLEGETRR